jgi:ferredoxin-2, mitochondrial
MYLRRLASEATRVTNRSCLRLTYSSSAKCLAEAKTVTINWKNRDGSIISTPAEIGSSLLRVAHKNGVEIEGACEGVCACSTCHVILEQGVYDELPEASEDEEDMLGTSLQYIPSE